MLALLQALRPERTGREGFTWVALLPVTALMHSYLLVMAGAIWGADWLRRAGLRRAGPAGGAPRWRRWRYPVPC